MSIELLLSIIGVVTPIVSGLVSWLKKSQPKITFVIDENINLYQEITKSIEGLSVTYNNLPIEKNSYLLKAFILYTGNKDVTKEEIGNKRLRLRLPKETKVHNFSILHGSNELETNGYITSDSIEFEFDILKDKDCVYFEALIETKEPLKEEAPFELTHRFANVAGVNETNFKLYVDLPNIAKFLFGLCFMLSLGIIYAIFYDSKHLYSFDFKTEYYLGNKKTDIDSLPLSMFTNKKKLVGAIKKNVIPIDSINNFERQGINTKQLEKELKSLKPNTIRYIYFLLKMNEIYIESTNELQNVIDGFVARNRILADSPEIRRLDYASKIKLKAENTFNEKYKINYSYIDYLFNNSSGYYALDNKIKIKFEPKEGGLPYFKWFFILLDSLLFSLWLYVAAQSYRNKETYEYLKRIKKTERNNS